jgi:hypothetical protein
LSLSFIPIHSEKSCYFKFKTLSHIFSNTLLSHKYAKPENETIFCSMKSESKPISFLLNFSHNRWISNSSGIKNKPI